MSCLTAERRSILLARKAMYETQLEAADLALTAAMTAHESYRLDTGQGSQQVKNRKIEDLTKVISYLEAKISSITRTLAGAGVASIVLRRRHLSGRRW